MRRSFFIVLAFILLFLFTSNIAQAANTTIGVSPQAGSYSKPFTVSFVIDGHGDHFNAAQAKVSVSSNMSIQNLTLGDCNFSFLKTPSIQNPSFAGVIMSSSTTKCTVYSLTLAPTKKGDGSISFSDVSVRRYGDAVEIFTKAYYGSYTFIGTSNIQTTVLGASNTVASKKDLYSLNLKIYSDETTTVNGATVTLKSIVNNQQQKGTTNSKGMVQFLNLKAGVYDVTIEKNGIKIGDNILNINGQNHTLSLSINLRAQKNNPLFKNAGSVLGLSTISPAFLIGVLAVGIIVGGGIAFFVVKFLEKKKS